MGHNYGIMAPRAPTKQLTNGEKKEIADFLVSNPKVSQKNVMALFSEKFKKDISRFVVYRAKKIRP